MREELLIVGDFNIHADSSNNESQGFLDILNANGLTQHVTNPTHQGGHTLDLVITREHSNLLRESVMMQIVDHYAVLCYLNVNRLNLRLFINL